jgi:phage terminase small subunit
MTRAEVYKALVAARNKPEKAALYADSFIEYREAQANIEKNGSIVADARTGAAVPNPFLAVRDKAFARLEALHKAGVKASVLWAE